MINNKNAKVLIATLDPQHGGGVWKLVEGINEILNEAGFKTSIAYLSMDKKRQFSIKNIKSWMKKASFSRSIVDGEEHIAIDIKFPEIEFLHYITNLKSWKEITDEKNIFISVGAGLQHAIPFALLGKPYICWVATAYLDELRTKFHFLKLRIKLMQLMLIPINLLLFRYACKKASLLISLTEYTAHRLSRECGIAKNDIKILPTFIDTEKYTFSPVDEREENTLLFIGRINDPRKNISMLLKAFSLVHTKHPEINLILIGEEPSQNIKNLCQKINIDTAVDFKGELFDEEKISYLKKESIFVIPSKQEGLCIALLEAMSCGMPVITTKCGGPQDYIIDGENGMLVENDNPKSLAKAIISLLNDKEKRRKLSIKARATIERDFNKKRIKDKMLEYIDEITKVLPKDNRFCLHRL